MSDSRLSAATRSLALGEPGAHERLIHERIRAGTPDPRRDPTPGAEVESRGRYNGAHSSRVRREVVSLWPQRLLRRSLVAPRFARAREDLSWLEPGTPVLTVERRVSLDGTRVYWRMWVRPLPDSPWIDVTTPDEPEVHEGEPLPVEAVEWLHSHWAAPKPQRSTLAAWRRWAKGGTVLHLGSGAR